MRRRARDSRSTRSGYNRVLSASSKFSVIEGIRDCAGGTVRSARGDGRRGPSHVRRSTGGSIKGVKESF
jgi:hypothetical protein